jgi:aryl-alcohol dehydrogenase-like predicted oxidoreductase
MQKNNLFGQFSLPISFGGAAVSGKGGGYGFGDISDADAISLLRYAFERGIKIFDTAPVYGFGQSELYIGQAFKQNREEVFITSKSGVSWHSNMRIDMTNDPKITQQMLEDSLRRLNCDYIDLYFIHWPDKRVDIRRPMEILAKAKLEGKIKHIGLCNSFVEDIMKAQEVDQVEVLQSEFNFFSRQAQESLGEFWKQLPFMGYGTLDKGVLTGRVTAEREQKRLYDRADCRSWAPWWKKIDRSRRFEIVEQLQPLLQKEGYSLLEFALAFSLYNGVDQLLIGSRTHQQIDSLLAALEHLPPQELIERIDQEYDC